MRPDPATTPQPSRERSTPFTTHAAAPCWWTAADAAEFDVLLDEFVRCYYAHHHRCPICLATHWCDPLADAFQAVIEWRRARMLRSRSVYLRLREELATLEQQLGARTAAVA